MLKVKFWASASKSDLRNVHDIAPSHLLSVDCSFSLNVLWRELAGGVLEDRFPVYVVDFVILGRRLMSNVRSVVPSHFTVAVMVFAGLDKLLKVTVMRCQ
jgi:hypothetical protein